MSVGCMKFILSSDKKEPVMGKIRLDNSNHFNAFNPSFHCKTKQFAMSYIGALVYLDIVLKRSCENICSALDVRELHGGV